MTKRTEAFAELSTKLRRHGYACVVAPSGRRYRVHVPRYTKGLFLGYDCGDGYVERWIRGREAVLTAIARRERRLAN